MMQTCYLRHHEVIQAAFRQHDFGDLNPSESNSTLTRNDPRMDITVRDGANRVLGVLIVECQGSSVSVREFQPDDSARSMPLPLAHVRSLPYGDYEVRVVHLEGRDNTRVHGATPATFAAQDESLHANVPHAIVHLGGRVYVIDDAQEFTVGDERRGSLQLHQRYKLRVSKPRSNEANLTEDRVQNAVIRYVPI